jgi:hypothetical protein
MHLDLAGAGRGIGPPSPRSADVDVPMQGAADGVGIPIGSTVEKFHFMTK